MIIQQETFNPTKTVKVFLLADERAQLANLINLPQDLSQLVRDNYFHVNYGSFDWDMVTEDGLRIPNLVPEFYPISWLNSPAQCKKWLKGNAANELKIILRRPAIDSTIPYDFPRSLISIHRKLS